MTPLLAAFIFMFGTAIGSFLSVVLWRLHTGEQFVFGRSHCTRCSHTLALHDLIPIVSYLSLRGRCRYCHHPVDPSYIVLEIITGTLFVIAAILILRGPLTFTNVARLLLDWYLIATFIVVFVFDLRHMLILRSVTLPAVVIAVVGNVALGMPVTSLALGMLLGAGFFYVQYTMSKGRWVGGGDIQLGLLIGAALGARYGLAAIFFAYITGAIYGTALVVLHKKELQSKIPFGTFLSASSVAMLLFGTQLLGNL